MVVKQERSIEAIRESLRRLEWFFSEEASRDADKTVLLSMERELIRMEGRLQMFSSYRIKEAGCSAS